MSDLPAQRPLQVSYDLTQLLDTMRQENNNANQAILTKLEGVEKTKADKSDLISIWSRIDHIGEELGTLKENEAARAIAEAARNKVSDDDQMRKNKRRDFAYAMAMVVLTVAVALGSLGIHV